MFVFLGARRLVEVTSLRGLFTRLFTVRSNKQSAACVVEINHWQRPAARQSSDSFLIRLVPGQTCGINGEESDCVCAGVGTCNMWPRRDVSRSGNSSRIVGEDLCNRTGFI